ncbi:arginine repressor [Ligilactobacillus saerimneri]|uniref:arginine repressor n=1 Tax=Ligilactobacillus saerimneri TaxID=228229 RepID=UPI001C11E612|nr:arginine repressor [Ligilactobacillus saerimneri]MBU5308899.1 arginine repressor [Ligilactobacillus saerimneri]
MKKEERQAIIERVIVQNRIGTQEELIKILHERGIKATQATISRDIRELHITKKADNNGEVRYVVYKHQPTDQSERLYKSIRDNVSRIDRVQFMLVVHTIARNANGLGAVIDDYGIPHVLGTLAGYDTIVLICDSEDSARQVEVMIKEHMQND